MSYYIPTGNCGGGSQADYSCGACIETEHGRIRSVAIVKTSYVATLMAANTALDSVWTTALSTGNIFALYATQGSYDGGTLNLKTPSTLTTAIFGTTLEGLLNIHSVM